MFGASAHHIPTEDDIEEHEGREQSTRQPFDSKKDGLMWGVTPPEAHPDCLSQHRFDDALNES